MNKLPEFISPMLAKRGEPFDSDDFLFEVKWDGVRAVVYVESDSYRIVNRHRNDITERYPEFGDRIQRLPAGTVLDCEIVMLDEQGRPRFSDLQIREHSRGTIKIRTLATTHPATLVVFDQLYSNFRSLMNKPLRDRRKLMNETVSVIQSPQIVASSGITGSGVEYFKNVVEQELEGVVAKRLNSKYLPGKRTDAWLKIKKQREINAVVVGYTIVDRDFESLLVAAQNENGELEYAGRVGSGLTNHMRDRLLEFLPTIETDQPLVPCKNRRAFWTEPVLYCRIRFLEWSVNHELRDPVIVELIWPNE